MKLIDGRKIRDEILSTLKDRVAALPFKPVFCDVLVGSDAASAQYVAMKSKLAESLGIATHKAAFPETITTEELVSEIKEIASLPHMSGLIIQLPLPAHIDRQAVLNAVPAHLDVDALGEIASERFYTNHPTFILPTAEAVLAVLGSLDIELVDKHVVVVGHGMLVGRPVTHLLKHRGITVDTIDSGTHRAKELYRSADIVISATGQAGLITGDILKPGVILVDAGTSESNGAISGDIDRASVEQVASHLAPVPGGVGPVTVAMLMNNVVTAAERIALGHP